MFNLNLCCLEDKVQVVQLFSVEMSNHNVIYKTKTKKKAKHLLHPASKMRGSIALLMGPTDLCSGPQNKQCRDVKLGSSN